MTDQPFRIALVGDFGARAHRASPETGRALAARRPLRVDRDTLDDALARLAPVLELELSTPDGERRPVRVAPRALDDFHPDRLLESLPVFRELLAMRDVVPPSLEPPAPRAAPAPSPGPADAGEALGLLERIVGEALPYTPAPAPPTSRDPELDAFVRGLVAPHLVSEPDARTRAWQAGVDAAVAAMMRALLHHPELQALEARWRAVELLVRRLDTDEAVRLDLVDASEADLRADLASDDDAAIGESGIGRLLTETGAPVSLVVGLFALGGDERDVALARRLARLGRLTGAAWVADAHHALAGAPAPLADCPDPDDWTGRRTPAWQELRRGPDAAWLALALPRVLLRLPYGSAGEPCERFAFEELDAERTGEPAPSAHFLWGSAAACWALLAGEAAADGNPARPEGELGGLPLFVRRVDGEPAALPCAEIAMTDRAARRLLERGLAPLAWMRDTDRVRLLVAQSVAEPAAPLAVRR